MDDASYKRLLNHRRIMQDLLIGFIAPRRPAGWAGALDFGSLRELPTENITDELRRRLGDVVWSIDRRAGDGGVQTLHVVIEHQSDVDYLMPLRFLNYTSLLYQRLYRDRTRWSKRDTADPVLQVVVYNGDRRWDAPVTLAGLVAGLEQDGPAQLALSYEVVDLVALKRDDLPRPNLPEPADVGGGSGAERARWGVAGAGAGVGRVARRRGGAGADHDLRSIAGRHGTEVGRGVAIDPRVRGGKRSVGGED